MRTIAHISDLHFGTEDLLVANALLKDLNYLKPSLVIISGDLTQRARKKQFIAAKEYISKIPYPSLIVPGNHDIPLFDIFRRFLFPLTRYKKYITDDLTPFYTDSELAVLGINTARSFTWKDGRISHKQIEHIKSKLCEIDSSIFKVIVTHHPFIPPPGDTLTDLVDRAELAMEVIDPCGIDLLLAGHLHHGYSGDIRSHYPSAKRPIIVAQAGTAISDRVRGEPNSYNYIILNKDMFSISIRVYTEHRFNEEKSVTYIKKEKEWVINS